MPVTVNANFSGDIYQTYVEVDEASALLVNSIVQSAKRSAEQTAPYSDNTIRPSGHRSLRAGTHFVELASRTNLQARFGNKAPHAYVVHEGRKGISKPYRMKWKVQGGVFPSRADAINNRQTRADDGAGTVAVKSVAAADAQPWLIDAYNRAAQRARVQTIRPMSPIRTRL